ncbi:MAG: DUF1475 family protein [Acidobacteriota bacterium]|nr:DUF1475 family protein [Acidobacteriota bacterium]
MSPINVRRALTLLFGAILVVMLAVTGWASSRVAIWNAGPDLRGPWAIATLFDAYCGFLTFFAWVCWKETRGGARMLWFVLVMLLGNIAMAFYVLRELARLGPGEGMAALLGRRNLRLAA